MIQALLLFLLGATLGVAQDETDANRGPLPVIQGHVKGIVRGVSKGPVAGAQLEIHVTSEVWGRTWPTEKLVTAVSGSDGGFRLVLPDRSILVDEKYALVVTHPDFAPASVFGVTPWNLRSLFRDVTLERGSPVEGTVRSADGLPAADIEVTVFRNAFGQQTWDYWEASTRTDAHGRFAFPQISTDRRGVVCRAADGREASIPWSLLASRGALNLVLGHREQRSTVESTSRSAASTSRPSWAAAAETRRAAREVPLTARVLDAVTREPIGTFAVGVSQDSRAVFAYPGQRVLFTPANAPEGQFTLNRVSPGRRFAVTLHAVGYAYRRVEIPTSAEPRAPEILLERGATVSGRLRNPEGTPITGARVQVKPEGITLSPFGSMEIAQFWCAFPHAFTDVEGRFQVEHVPAGRHVVVAAHPKFVPVTSAVIEVGANSTQVSEMTLAPGGRIVGRVENSDWLQLGTDIFGPISVPLHGNSFEIDGLPTGDYVLTVGAYGRCIFDSTKVHVTRGETTEVTVTRRG